MKKVLIIVILVLVVGGGAGYYYMNIQSKSINKSNPSNNILSPTQTTQSVPTNPPPTIAKVVVPTTVATPIPSLSLTITSPAGGSVVNTPQIQIKGSTVTLAEVFVNDSQVSVDTKGNFSSNVTLEEGENYILVSANDANGVSAEQEIIVTYTPKQ
jgi:hypothetical protein